MVVFAGMLEAELAQPNDPVDRLGPWPLGTWSCDFLPAWPHMGLPEGTAQEGAGGVSVLRWGTYTVGTGEGCSRGLGAVGAAGWQGRALSLGLASVGPGKAWCPSAASSSGTPPLEGVSPSPRGCSLGGGRREGVRAWVGSGACGGRSGSRKADTARLVLPAGVCAPGRALLPSTPGLQGLRGKLCFGVRGGPSLS